MRIKFSVEPLIQAGTTKLVTFYVPQGFRVITPFFDLGAGGAPAGTMQIISSKPTFKNQWIDENMADFPLADGSTALTIPSEGWVFKVASSHDSQARIRLGAICEEGSMVTSEYTNGDYPFSIEAA